MRTMLPSLPSAAETPSMPLVAQQAEKAMQPRQQTDLVDDSIDKQDAPLPADFEYFSDSDHDE